MAAPIWNPPARVANDVASVTIAGHPFAWAGMTGGKTGGMTGGKTGGKTGGMTGGTAGGILSLRVGLRGSTLVELARALGRLEGVRVTSGPAIASRGDCFLVHCPGFKMVLSAPAPGEDFAPALLSPTLAPVLAVPCELSALFEALMNTPSPRVAQTPPRTPGEAPSSSPPTSTLRRTGLQPGKTLARKKPLLRKAPLSRGRWSKP
jgi:hypothetical protein